MLEPYLPHTCTAWKILNEIQVPQNCKLKMPEQIVSTFSSTDRSLILYICSQNSKNTVCDVNVFCNLLTGKPAVVAAVTVVSIKLRGDWHGFAHQQKDKAHSCHFSTWANFSHCHIQKVTMALTAFLACVLTKMALIGKLDVQKQCYTLWPLWPLSE